MISRFDPFSDIQRLQDQFRRVHQREERPQFVPTVDIFEDAEGIHLRADLAGLKAEDVHVQFENRVLTLSGERKQEHERVAEGYHRIERAYGQFSRSFAVPSSVDGENIQATMREGVLTLMLPKKSPAQARKITVTS
ncbi:MAG: Hsp20/alpha crystallin family protein [Deltaproteobacteria bacterium]|nr:Hsp20/alpha crystallin family protein [Deltaproteobacteria bacterium]